MATCDYQPWSVKDLAAALKSMHADKKEIVVPIFQRGKRWKTGQENAFIDSLTKGYPVGTMLFYRTVSGEKEIYTLVDGLQRGNTIKKFMLQPTNYFSINQIPESIDPGRHYMITTIRMREGFEIINEAINEVINEAISEVINRQVQIMNIMKELPNITKPQLAERMSLSKSTIDREIKKLIESGLIIRSGSNKTGFWEVLK